MKTGGGVGQDLPSRRRFLYAATGVGVASVVGVGSVRGEQAIEIGDWHDLDAVREALDGDYVLTADLDETTPGYDEHVAEPEDGWKPIGNWPYDDVTEAFTGTFDGNDHELTGLRSSGVTRTDRQQRSAE